MINKKIYGLYAALLLLIACGSDGSSGKENTAPTGDANRVTLSEAQARQADLRTEVLPLRESANTISVKGQVEAPPSHRVSVSSPLGGYVKDIRLHIGDRVSKGQALLQLEDMQFIQLQQDYLAAKARLEPAKNEYERQEQLGKTQAASSKQVETAKADFENLKVQTKALAEKLRLIGIDPDALNADNLRGSLPLRSPVNGFVTAVYANVGKYASGADVLMELVDPSDIHLSLRVFEKDLPFLHIGQRVSAYTNTDPQKKYEARIVLIGKTLNEEKWVEVHCHFLHIPSELIPGLYMNADIEAEGAVAPALPQEALITENGGSFVFVESGPDVFDLVPVDIRWSGRDSVGIAWKNAAPEGQKTVTKNAYSLYMQLRNKGE